MRATATLALLAIVASATASADELFGPRAAGARTAAFYVEVPLGAARHRYRPAFGLRLQELRLPRSTVAAHRSSGYRTLLDVPLVARKDDPLRDAGAVMLLGKGAIVGIVVGAVVAVSVINDDGDGGGY